MLKIALGQMETIPGRPDLNTATIINMIHQARKDNVDIIIFPEMSVPGYLLGDLWEQQAFLRDCEDFGRQITANSQDICVMFGNVGIDWDKRNDDGRVRKYNAFFAAYNGKLLGNNNFPYPFRIKTLQPNYREFEDTRHFYSLRKLAVELDVKIENLLVPVQLVLPKRTLNIGCILCEDGWVDDYAVKPIATLHKHHSIDLFVNISSSPYTLGKNNKRNRVFSKQAKETQVPLIYVNTTGIQNNGKTVYTFDGVSTVYSGNGEIIAYCEPFHSAVKTVEIDLNDKGLNIIATEPPNDQTTASIYQALHYGIDRFTKSLGIKKVVIGISGGIDSALAAAIYTKVLGPSNILLVNMPSIYNSNTTKNLAFNLASNLGCLYTVIPIQESVNHTITQISNSAITDLQNNETLKLTVSPFVSENIQARDRSSRILAGIAAAFGGVFTCNANKSELSVGYSTLYGDQAGFFAALADLWKHQIYDLARYMNEFVFEQEIIPQETIDIVPSAELSFDQAVDEGKGDPIVYPYHDYLFRSFMEFWNRATPEDILQWYIDGTIEQQLGCPEGIISKLFVTRKDFIDDLEKWWKLYSGMAVAKRIQAPPVLAISRRAYGFDHREAQNGVYFTAKYLNLKNQLLAKQANTF
ncbi:NAD(+) synthase [Dendrosporobacter sp. 1207_IL3150]|uniref:NAD(+) synthase n=1 Tax=Dendrosporobacter sp. 1207_IL3150 TaxID=3084054 RepID=UPI002FDB1F89